MLGRSLAFAFQPILALWLVALFGVGAAAEVTGGRFALVVGNGAYTGELGALRNPVNDARLMARTLRGVGFDVRLVEDAGERALEDAVVAFGGDLRRSGNGGVALFYYAGHGVQSKGANYLIPVGAQVESEQHLKTRTVPATLVLEEMEEAPTALNIVVLDACRNNPYAASGRSVGGSRGLARMDTPPGSFFLAYSAAAGQVADDGDGENSVYTGALAAAMTRPGLELEEVFKRAGRTVRTQTGGSQVPWREGSWDGAFHFVSPLVGVDPGREPGMVAPQQPRVDAPDPAAETWMQIRATANAQMLERYLATYPNSPYRMAAEARLKELNRQPFTVAVRPSEAHVRILNSALPYQKGMLLPPGDYRIEATAEGYETKVEVVAHGHSPTSHRLVLVPTDDFRDCEGCPEMVVIPAGVFRMGDLAGDGEPHEVRIADRFALSKYETTVAQFRRFVLATGYRTDAEQDTERGCFSSELEKNKWGWTARRSWQELEYPLEDEQPVVCVSWADARAYVRWLRDGTRLPYRLPSEVEWEYAARARNETMYHFGDDEKLLCKYGNVADKTRWPDGRTFDNAAACLDGNVYTTIVGSYRPNAFGLHDVVGNVWEWMADCWNGSDAGVPADGRAWETGDCKSHVVRGGSWSSTPEFLRRSASRLEITIGRRDSDVGFRVARTLAP